MTTRKSAARQAAGWAAALAAALTCACHPDEPPAAPKPQVRTAQVRSGPIEDRLELPARVVPPPELDATLAPQVAGRLALVPVREGQSVAKGELLAEVEREGLTETLKAAEAEVAHARTEEAARTRVADVTRALFAKGIAAAEESANDQAAAAAATAARADAEAKVAQARRSAGWAELRAPFPGVVVQLLRHRGEAVDGTPATPVLRLAGVERTEALARATGLELARVRPGNPALLSIGTAEPVKGRVARVSGAVDPTTGLGEVGVTLDGVAKVPLFSEARLVLVITTHPAALLVPASALRRGEDGTDELVVVETGVAHPRAVRLGLRQGETVEVLAGVKAGDAVVVDQPLGLADGDPVTATAGPAA